MGSTSLKAAEMRNHRKGAFSGLPVNRFSTIFAPLIAPRFAPKTIARAERADRKPLPTDHDANLYQKCEIEDAPVMILMLSVTFRLTAFETHIAQVCAANTTCKIHRMHVRMMSSSRNRRCRIACFLSPTCNCMPSIN